MDFNILLCSKFIDLNDEYKCILEKYNNISYSYCDFTELDGKFDCIVSPGNSYGIFDGGFDGDINRYFSEIELFVRKMQIQLIEKMRRFSTTRNLYNFKYKCK
jgi:hypothetical protein